MELEKVKIMERVQERRLMVTIVLIDRIHHQWQSKSYYFNLFYWPC